MVEDKGCNLCGQREQTVYHILSIRRKFQVESRSLWEEEEKRYAWCNIITKLMLTLPKSTRKVAIFMKNTDLLEQFKARNRDEEDRT